MDRAQGFLTSVNYCEYLVKLRLKHVSVYFLDSKFSHILANQGQPTSTVIFLYEVTYFEVATLLKIQSAGGIQILPNCY